MGDKAEEYEAGANCNFCWGEGKEFGDNSTPKYVYITGSGFGGACAPCNGTFLAEQDPFAPCTWNFVDGVVSGGWTNGPVFAVVNLAVAGVGECFAGTDWKCVKNFTVGDKTVNVS